MTPLEILQGMRTLLTPPEAWTQGYYARTKYDLKVEDNSPRAVKWCLMGAIGKVYHSPLYDWRTESKVITLLRSVLPEGYCGAHLPLFNDAPSTTHADILALLDRAILLAQKEAQP